MLPAFGGNRGGKGEGGGKKKIKKNNNKKEVVISLGLVHSKQNHAIKIITAKWQKEDSLKSRRSAASPAMLSAPRPPDN